MQVGRHRVVGPPQRQAATQAIERRWVHGSPRAHGRSGVLGCALAYGALFLLALSSGGDLVAATIVTATATIGCLAATVLLGVGFWVRPWSSRWRPDVIFALAGVLCLIAVPLAEGFHPIHVVFAGICWGLAAVAYLVLTHS